MSKREERDRLEQPVANLEVFEGAISKAAQDLTERMGQLVTEGVSEQDLVWMARVSDVAERIMGPLERLFQAINDAPYNATVAEEESGSQELGSEEISPSTLKGTAELFAMPEGLSEDESARLTKAFEVLGVRAQVPEKGGVHIRQVVESVFGTSTIPNADFTKFVGNLNKIAKRRGPWYFIEADSSTDMVASEASLEGSRQESESIEDTDSSMGTEARPLEGDSSHPEHEESITLLLNDRESQIWYQVLAGGSTSEWFGQSDLDLGPLQFVSSSARNTAFSLFTKKALGAGILIDNGKARGARRYKIASGVETTSADQVTEESDNHESDDPISEPPETQLKDQVQHNQKVSTEGLTAREQRILGSIIASVADAEWFKQSEVDLSDIEFSSDSARKQAFAKLTGRAIELGILIDNGKARGGKKYRVLNAKVPIAEPSSQHQAEVVTPIHRKSRRRRSQTKTNGAPKPLLVPFYDAQKTKASPIEGSSTPIQLSERDIIRSERLSRAVISYISTAHLTEKRSSKPKTEKIAFIAKDIAQRMGIEVEEARELVKNLVEGGSFHVNGHIKGSPLLSTEAPEINELDGHELTSTEIETKRDQERQRIFELREIYEEGILTFLSGLTKEQTEFKTAIASALGDDVSADDVNEICNLLRADGLLEPKKAAGRGSRRTRKGKTWKITGPGRRKLNEMKSEMTNKEKKQIGKGLSTAKQS